MNNRSDTPNAGGKSGPSVGARSGPPAELVPDVSTNMYVVNKIGELTTAVKHLESTLQAQGGKLDKLNTKINWAEGALFVLGLGGAVVGYFLNAKWTELIEVLQTIREAMPS